MILLKEYALTYIYIVEFDTSYFIYLIFVNLLTIDHMVLRLCF